jgi:hypothetical protein
MANIFPPPSAQQTVLTGIEICHNYLIPLFAMLHLFANFHHGP